MRGAMTIAGKDLRGLFMSPVFYIVAAICTLSWTLMFIFSVRDFTNQSMMQMMQSRGAAEGVNLHYAVFARHISLVNLVMIFAVSCLTMRLFTEEKRQRTYDLLLTSPVTATEIMFGKLIAGVLTAWALVGISFLYPLSLAPFTLIEWGPLFSSYIGLLLISATYVAIGMFTSSLTQNTAVAVLMALICNVMFWFIGVAGESSDDQSVQAIFQQMNVGQHFVTFIKGQISIASLTFLLSVIFLASFFTQRVIESSRWR